MIFGERRAYSSAQSTFINECKRQTEWDFLFFGFDVSWFEFEQGPLCFLLIKKKQIKRREKETSPGSMLGSLVGS